MLPRHPASITIAISLLVLVLAIFWNSSPSLYSQLPRPTGLLSSSFVSIWIPSSRFFHSPSIFNPASPFSWFPRSANQIKHNLNKLTTDQQSTANMSSTNTSSADPYAKEIQIATLAVQRASLLTQRIFHRTSKGTVLKPDQSPVTVGDFGAQALIIAALKHAFPGDEIVAEEEAADLRADPSLSSTVWELVKETALENSEAEALIGGPISSESEMLELIDSGKSQGGGVGRIWAIDPIDGTKGFVRGDQYAVCLGLIVDGTVRVGVLGCPNLPIRTDNAGLDIAAVKALPESEKGVLFYASKNHGSYSQPLYTVSLNHPSTLQSRVKLSVSNNDIKNLSFCESFEETHSAHNEHAQIAALLNLNPVSVRMDSQAKYGALARGLDVVYLRLPVVSKKTGKAYPHLIWDHAAGNVIVTEAGGKIMDSNGNELNFGAGRILVGNAGIVAAPGNVFEKVIDAVKAVVDDKTDKQ